MTDRRLRIGRLAIYIEPRDVWVGVYVALDAVYVCPLPMLVLRWDRRRVRLGRLRLAPVAVRGCDDCPTEPGERHDRTCPRVPRDWFTEVRRG